MIVYKIDWEALDMEKMALATDLFGCRKMQNGWKRPIVGSKMGQNQVKKNLFENACNIDPGQ